MEDKIIKNRKAEPASLCQPEVKPEKPSGVNTRQNDVFSGEIIPAADVEVRDILDALPFYVLLIDSEHYIVDANSAVKIQLGVERKDILGKYCPLIIHGINQPFEGCPLEEAAEKNIAVERELLDKTTGRWVRSAIYPTRAFTQDGKRIFLHLVMDITERKLAEEQLQISHKQLRELSAHLETVREEEKRKIARDLHDETSQLLASLYTFLEAAIANLPEGASRARELLKKAQSLSTAILDEAHKLIYELRPAMLDELGLIAAVNFLIENNLKVLGLKVNFKTVGKAKRLSPALEISLFRIIQEMFNNIIKHSRAKRVKLSLQFNKNSLKVVIKDDGVGFPVQETVNPRGKSRGMGLVGMRERVESMQGTLVIGSSPGQGTEITVEVPITNGGSNG
jgi:PAS domain S-box-containing protein